MIHKDITPIKAFILSSFLFDDPKDPTVKKCKIFSISSYPGHVPTFNILIEDKYIYSYVSSEQLSKTENFEDVTLEKLCYENCVSGDFSWNEFEYLKNKTVTIFNKDKTFQCKGKYIGTMDWYNENNSLHLIEGNDGCFYFRPNHKVIFTDNSSDLLPPFKKIKQEFKL